MCCSRLVVLPCVHFRRILFVRLHGSARVMVQSSTVHVRIGGRVVTSCSHLSLILLHHCGMVRVVSSVWVMSRVHAGRWDPWWHLSVGYLRRGMMTSCSSTISHAIVVRVLHTVASIVRVLYCLALWVCPLCAKLTLRGGWLPCAAFHAGRVSSV